MDLKNLIKINDLELNFNIINPNRVRVQEKDVNSVVVSKNLIKWNLILGEINSLEFSFWTWNKLLIGSLFILLIIIVAYFLRFYRYQIGSDFPELPSN